MAGKDKFTYTVDVATKNASKNLKDAAKEAKKLGTDLDDTRSAGKKLADAMDQVTGELETEFKQAKSAADKLADSLGTAGVDAVNRAGKSVDDLVQDLKRAGLTYEDIEADSDALAASMKRMADVGDDINTHVTKNMEHVATATDDSRSVMANFAGNAVQEMPGVANAFGPLNMAISQFTEYASEGKIQLGGLISAGGGMALVTVAMQTLASRAQKLESIKTLKSDYIKGYSNALKDASSRWQAIATAMEETGKVELILADGGEGLTGTLLGGVAATVDLKEEFAALGVTYEGMAKAMANGEEGIKEYGAALVAQGVDADKATTIMGFMTQQLGYVQEAEKGAAAEAKLAGKDIKDAHEKAARATDALNETEQALQDTYRNRVDTIYDVNRAQLEADSNYATYQQHVQAYNDALTDTNVTEAERSQMLRDLALEQMDFVDGLAQGGAAYAQQQGAAEGSNAALSMQIGYLESQKGKYPELSAMIDEYIAKLKAIPGTIATNVSVKLPSGAFTGQGGQYRNGARATGGPVEAGGVYSINEWGQESFIPAVDGTVLSAEETRKAGSGQTYVDNRKFYINVPNQTPEQTALSIAKYNKRNGLS